MTTSRQPKPKPQKPAPFGERMLAWRGAKGLSQTQAAELAGVSLRNWQNWEQGHRLNPRLNGIMPVLGLLLKDGF